MDLRRERKKGNRVLGVLIITALLCMALIIMLLASLGIRQQREKAFADVDGLEPDAERSGGEVFSLLLGQNAEDELSYEIKGELLFKTASSEGELLLKNPAKNRYPIRLELLLDKSGERVLKTGLLLPGYILKATPLDEKIENGSYEATAVISAVDPESLESVGSVTQPVKLIIGDEAA